MSLYYSEVARRSTWTCVSCSCLSRASQAMIASPPRTSSAPLHQRKHSSSKASSASKDEPRAITTASETPAKGTESTSAEEVVVKRPRASKRKPKDTAQETPSKNNNTTQLNLPSVPSTQHLNQHDIHIASFFSQHRPISVSTTIPPPTTSTAFAAIFSPTLKKHSDVISTLSSTISHLQGQTPEELDLRTAIAAAASSKSNNPSNQPSEQLPAKTFHLNLAELAKKFRPFAPPPPPVPLEAMQEAAMKTKGERVRRKRYTTTLTVEESTYENGRRIYKTYTSPTVEEPTFTSPHLDEPSMEGGEVFEMSVLKEEGTTGFGHRMRERRVGYAERLGERVGGWMAISVKRQRKLKMKKHKYKKLMKRTKNLRRRLYRL